MKYFLLPLFLILSFTTSAQTTYTVEVGPGIPLGSPDGSLDEPWNDKKSDVKYIPTQAEIGDYALFLGKASIEIKTEIRINLFTSIASHILSEKRHYVIF